MRTNQERDGEQKKKQLLMNALKRGKVDASGYSLNGYKEEAVCIEKKNNKWLVYDGERGRQHNIEQYRDFEVAGYRLINRLSDSDEAEAVIMADYLVSILSYAASLHVAVQKTKPKKTVRK